MLKELQNNIPFLGIILFVIISLGFFQSADAADFVRTATDNPTVGSQATTGDGINDTTLQSLTINGVATTAKITAPTGATVTIKSATVTNPTSNGKSITFAIVVDITITNNNCSTGCTISITVPRSTVVNLGLDPSNISIFRDSEKDGSYIELATTCTGTTTLTCTAITTQTSNFLLGGGGGSSTGKSGSGRISISPPKITDYMTSPTLIKFEDGSIGYGGFIQKEISLVNEMPTATIETGDPIALSYKIRDVNGAETISYSAFYTNIRGDQSDIEKSDTYMRYYKGKTLQVSDPNKFFSSTDVTLSKVDAYNVIATFNVTFARPMETSDVIVRVWDDNRQGYTSKFIDALRVIEPIPFLNSGNPFTVETTNEGMIAVRSLGDENKIWYLVEENWKETPEEDQLDETFSRTPTLKYVSLEEDGKEAYREFLLDLNQQWKNQKYSEEKVTKTPNVIDHNYEYWDVYKKGQELIAQETLKKILDPTYSPNKSNQNLVYNEQDITQSSLTNVQYEKNTDNTPNKGLVGDDYVWYNYKEQRGLLEKEKVTQKNKVWLLGNNGDMEEFSDKTITKLEKGFYGKIDQSTVELLYNYPAKQIEPKVKKPISTILDRTHDYWDAYKKGQAMFAQTKLVDVTNDNFFETSPKIEQEKTFGSKISSIGFTWNENKVDEITALDRTSENWDTYKQGQIFLAQSTLNEMTPSIHQSDSETELNLTQKWMQYKEENKLNKQLNREHEDWENYKYEQELKAQEKLKEILDPSYAKKKYEQANREALIAFQSRS